MLCIAGGSDSPGLSGTQGRHRRICRRLSRFSNLCPQFHLSLQSGSDAVLTRMRRKYHTERYLQSVTLLRTFFPGCALTTDLIVGFPGETEAELSESLSFARQCRFAAMHVFPYSRRPGTPAAEMPGQLSKTEKSSQRPSPGGRRRAGAGIFDRASGQNFRGTL